MSPDRVPPDSGRVTAALFRSGLPGFVDVITSENREYRNLTVLQARELVAEHGWRLLPTPSLDPRGER